jgi:hypothetical protein
MTLRFIVGLVAAVLFVLAGFTGFNEGSDGPHLAYLWFGLAAATAIVALTLPGDRPAR